MPAQDEINSIVWSIGVKTCYMCDRDSTSDEHIPPRCFFPESKDVIDGKDYRKNLITVRSCDKHNSHKSGHDEWLFSVFAANMHANSVGRLHQNTKLTRMVERRSKPIRELIESSGRAFLVDTAGNCRETIAKHIDPLILLEQLEHIAKGLYYHHFKSKFLSDVIVAPLSGLISNSELFNKSVLNLGEMSNTLFLDSKKFGENPDVFYYQTSKISSEHLSGTLIRASFYDGIVILFHFPCD